MLFTYQYYDFVRSVSFLNKLKKYIFHDLYRITMTFKYFDHLQTYNIYLFLINSYWMTSCISLRYRTGIYFSSLPHRHFLWVCTHALMIAEMFSNITKVLSISWIKEENYKPLSLSLHVLANIRSCFQLSCLSTSWK